MIGCLLARQPRDERPACVEANRDRAKLFMRIGGDMQASIFLYNLSGHLVASTLPPGGTGVMEAAALLSPVGGDNVCMRSHVRITCSV
jgi:hypothetical protein